MTEDKKDTIVEPKTIGELVNKMRLEGVVKTNEIFGVLVDVGVDYDGLVHISEINRHNNEVDKQNLDVGQKITVWVKKTDENSIQKNKIFIGVPNDGVRSSSFQDLKYI